MVYLKFKMQFFSKIAQLNKLEFQTIQVCFFFIKKKQASCGVFIKISTHIFISIKNI